jgi:hypothetical protein
VNDIFFKFFDIFSPCWDDWLQLDGRRASSTTYSLAATWRNWQDISMCVCYVKLNLCTLVLYDCVKWTTCPNQTLTPHPFIPKTPPVFYAPPHLFSCFIQQNCILELYMCFIPVPCRPNWLTDKLVIFYFFSHFGILEVIWHPLFGTLITLIVTFMSFYLGGRLD